MLRTLNQVSGVFLSVRCCIRFGGDKYGKRISFMRRRKRVAHGAEVAGAQHKILAPATFRPCAVLLASFPFPLSPFPHGRTGSLQRSATPHIEGWGIFHTFFPNLRRAEAPRPDASLFR